VLRLWLPVGDNAGVDGVMQAEADDTVIVRVEGPGGSSPRTGPKASMSGFQRLAQLRQERGCCWISTSRPCSVR
jgi:hypothetical protein